LEDENPIKGMFISYKFLTVGPIALFIMIILGVYAWVSTHPKKVAPKPPMPQPTDSGKKLK
jgi:hypothetical protein